ncbi:hypothetical protein, partial [Vibrio parahaemolyticus]|uniref:hypothetical protein n=1 Tax=Vibrio parahaemolyticus TaxID=670 RepID=UPI001A8EB524
MGLGDAQHFCTAHLLHRHEFPIELGLENCSIGTSTQLGDDLQVGPADATGMIEENIGDFIL